MSIDILIFKRTPESSPGCVLEGSAAMGIKAGWFVHQSSLGCRRGIAAEAFFRFLILLKTGSRERSTPARIFSRPCGGDSNRLQRRECRGESCLFHRICPVFLLLASAIMATAQAPSAPGKPLPPGPAQAKIKATCTSCHNTSRITEQHLSRPEWSAELEKMEGLGAVIPDADRNAFLSYLTKNFGPEKSAAKPTKKSGS